MDGPTPTPASGPLAAAPHPWLVADIGGTNARFGWVETPGGAIEHVASLPVAEHAGPLEAARAYLATLQRQLADRYRPPGAAAWAVATAVVGDVVELTNAGWRFARTALQRELGLRAFLLLNDFEALALSLPNLGPAQWRRVGEAAHQVAVPTAARAVIGPGTGLGVAGLVPCPGREPGDPAHWLALPGEGGHVTLAPCDDLESELLRAVRRLHPHVSAERLLSGIGLPDLHRAVLEVRGAAVRPLRTEAIVAAGLAPEGAAEADPACRETLTHFCALLGGFAGNVALTLGARGGVYIGGGIAPRLGDFFLQSRFRERFEAKGRFETYLRAIPTWLIVDTQVALAGAAMALQQHRTR